MKIYTLYYDRYETATTSKDLKEIEHTVLCHSNAEKFKNIFGNIIETGEEKGIQNQFNWGLRNAEIGEWIIFCSDDHHKSFSFREGKFIESSINNSIEVLREEIDNNKKDKRINLIGLGLTTNPFYAKARYSKGGLVDGRLFAIRKTEFKYDRSISTIPDYEATIHHLEYYGRNLIINHQVSEFKRYSSGGLGSITERTDDKIRDCKTLVRKYHPMLRYADKKGHPKGSHVRIYYRAK